MQGVRTKTLSAVPEEQESQIQSETPRGTKRSRRTGDGDDNDVEMADGAPGAAGTSAGTSEGAHRAKRRALDAPAPAPTAQPRSTTQTQTQGTGTGTTTVTGTKHAPKPPPSSSTHKLDTDENFLRAVNSTKRGKKLEDDFDREFNLLRIAKPKQKLDGTGPGTTTDTATAAARAPEVDVAPWDAIDDFGDVGIRGNFIVVVELDIERGGSARPPQSTRTDCTTRPEWAGRPNFKKFKAVRIILLLLFLFSERVLTDGSAHVERYCGYRAQGDDRARSQRGERLRHRKRYHFSFKSRVRGLSFAHAPFLFNLQRIGGQGRQARRAIRMFTTSLPRTRRLCTASLSPSQKRYKHRPTPAADGGKRQQERMTTTRTRIWSKVWTWTQMRSTRTRLRLLRLHLRGAEQARKPKPLPPRSPLRNQSRPRRQQKQRRRRRGKRSQPQNREGRPHGRKKRRRRAQRRRRRG